VSRRFKRIALVTAVLITVSTSLYRLLDVLFNLSDWATEKQGLWTRLWAGAISPKGSVIVTAVLALFVVCVMLADRRLDAARDLKWKRRKRVLEYKSRGLIKAKKVSLTDGQREEVFTFQKQIKDLYDQALHTTPKTLEADIKAWEGTAGSFLESNLGREYKAFVMDAPHSPATRSGLARVNYLIGWTHTRLDKMNALIEELHRQ